MGFGHRTEFYIIRKHNVSETVSASVFMVGNEDTYSVGSLSKELELEFFLRPTVSRPVRLGIGPPFGILDQILSSLLLSFNNYVVLLSMRPL
jgi:hypothetical protein